MPPAQLLLSEKQTNAAARIDPEPEIRDLSLQGVVIASTVRKALIATANEPQGTWVLQGGSISGWRIVSITPVSALLAWRDKERALGLFPGGSVENSGGPKK